MRTKDITVAVVLVLAGASPLLAESPYERELKDLLEQRDKAVASAIEPINRRYRGSIEQLLRKATQANDLDAALKAKQALEAMGGSSPGVRTSEFVGLWTLAYPDGASYTRELRPDGTFITNSKKEGKWTVTPTHLKLDHEEAGRWERFDLPIKNGQLTGINSKDQLLRAIESRK